MTSFLTAMTRRRGALALRSLAAMGLAASLAGCYSKETALSAISQRLSRAPSDHAEGRRADGRNLSRPQSRRSDAEPARRRAGLRANLAARGDRRHHRRRAARRADRPRRRRFAARGAFHPRRLRRAGEGRVRTRLSRRRGPRLPASRSTTPSSIATAGPCGLWPNDLGVSVDSDYIENRSYWNLGCASQRNLAAMVDNPADLVQPRGETPAYTPRVALSLSTNTARATRPAALIRATPATAMTTANSATSANDQARATSGSRRT